MKKLFLLIFLFLSLHSFAFVNQNNDFQFWIRKAVRFPLSKKHALEITSEERFGDDASDFFFYYVQGQFFIPIDDNLTIAPSYRQSYLNLNLRREWIRTVQPFLDLFYTKKIKKVTFLNRARFSDLFPEDFKPFLQFRDLTQFTFPPIIKGVSPYISDEVFFDEFVGFSQNRFILGLSLEYNKHLEGLIYYLLRYALNGPNIWAHQDILGVQLRYSF